MSVVTRDSKNGATRYHFVVSDFRDRLRLRSYHIKGDQYQCLSIEAWSCRLNLVKDDLTLHLSVGSTKPVIMLAPNFDFCLCLLLSSPPFHGCWILGHYLKTDNYPVSKIQQKLLLGEPNLWQLSGIVW